MVFPFTCPRCGITTDVSEEYLGQSGPCAGCGETVTVTPPVGMPGYSAQKRGSATAIVAMIVLVGILGVIVLCGFSLFNVSAPIRTMPAPAPSMAANSYLLEETCRETLELIGAAMLEYHDDHGTFPPAYIADDDGKPMHSWRVLLLPYLDQDALYTQYDFDKPWDSPENLALAFAIPDIYICRENNQNESDALATNYLMVTGPGTVSHEGSKSKSKDVTDGTGETILVVESVASGIQWTEPKDLDIQEMSLQINAGFGIEGHGPIGAHVLFCDGTVRQVHIQTNPKDIKSMTTIAGGEPEVTIHYAD